MFSIYLQVVGTKHTVLKVNLFLFTKKENILQRRQEYTYDMQILHVAEYKPISP
jgi:hypothetical protein